MPMSLDLAKWNGQTKSDSIQHMTISLAELLSVPNNANLSLSIRRQGTPRTQYLIEVHWPVLQLDSGLPQRRTLVNRRISVS